MKLTRDQKIALFFGVFGLALAAAALVPAYRPAIFDNSPADARCAELRSQLITVSGDYRAQRKIARDARRHLSSVESDIAYANRRKQLIEGFFVELEVRNEMRSYASILHDAAAEFKDEFASFDCTPQRCVVPKPILDRFYSSMIDGGIPSSPGTRRDKRLVFMSHGFDPSDYRIFDFLPSTPEEAERVASELQEAASVLGPNSDYLWRDTSWGNTFETIEGPQELEDQKAALVRLAPSRLQAEQNVSLTENEEKRLKRLFDKLNSEVKELDCRKKSQ